MEVGLFFSFRNPAPFARRWSGVYRNTLDQVVAAEERGFDAVWLGEHHFTDDGFSSSPLTVAAAVAARTQRVQIGTYVLLLPLYDPVRLAEEAATVDILSDGRLVLGLGLGYRPEEYDVLGIPHAERGARMEEGLEILLRAFAENEFSFEGRFHRYTRVAMSPKSESRARPRILIGGSSEAMLRRAARLGCDGLALQPPPALHRRYLELLEEYGRDASEARYHPMVLGFVGETDDIAWDIAQRHANFERDQYNRWWRSAGVPALFPNGAREDFVIGSPARWLEAVPAFLGAGEGVPCHHLVVQLTTSGMEHRLAMDAIERFATDVLPELRRLEVP